MLGLSRKRVQINPGDAGRYDIVEGIRLGLDREYSDWKDPQGTHMVPDLFPSDQKDKGKIAEESVYNLVQQCGTRRKEPMFVVHSCPFSEHIPESGRKKSWVMGETDFVIIHKIHGPIYFEVKATDTGKSFKEAEEQLQKGKLALQKHFEKAVKGEIPTRKVIEIFKHLPAFVAMPNCPRPSEVCALKANALYKEDCSSLEEFDKWWNNNVVAAKHPAVDQKIFEDLVIWFVGLSCPKPLGVSLPLSARRQSLPLKLRKRQESAERQNQAHDEVLDDHRVITAEESHESEIWIDDHFKRVLKNLVHSHIEAENQFYGLQERRQSLESAKSNGKVPSDLKIRCVTAKGRNAQPLQEKFNNIIQEAEIKLLEATIASLKTEEQQSKERCGAEKQKIFAAIETSRTSFQSSDATLDMEADEFVKSAKCFAERFYFERAATRASKRVAENLETAAT